MSRSNNDFRAMLAAKSAPLSIPATRVATKSASSEQKAQLNESRRLHFANKRHHQDGNHGNNDNVDKDDSTQAKYRDRAAERRQGKVIDGDDDATKVESNQLGGGDVEHTHSVKGLDFTLLARVRAEQEQQKQTEFSNVVDATLSSSASNTAPTRRRASGKTTATTTISTTDADSARTALGKSVLKALFGEPAAQNPRMFPGHMYYSFDLSPKIPPLPKSVVRAKADVPVLAYTMSSVEKLVLARVSRTVAEGRDPSIRARKAAEAAARDEAARRAVEEADEDIFADAGTYVTATVSEDVTAPSRAQQPVDPELYEQELLAAQLADEQLAADNAAFFAEMEEDANSHTNANRNDDSDAEEVDGADQDDFYANAAGRRHAAADDSDGSEPMDDVEVDDDADERARKLLVARGLAVAEDEYGAIGMSNSTLPSVFGDDDDDGDGGKGKQKSSEKQDQKQKASKFNRDLRTVSEMVDKKAADRGAKRMIGEHSGASEKKRNRK